MPASTVDQNEVNKFANIANEWWDVNGKFKPLHEMNPLRIAFIKQEICEHFNLRNNQDLLPLKNLSVLDVGCGGGLLSAPIARLGADVMGIDVAQENIEVAKYYCQTQQITNARFLQSTVEDLAQSEQKFQVLLCLEVVEHVVNLPLFINSLRKLLVPNGLLILSTLNRTIKSLMIAKIGAEYIAKILPRGTHDWRKFIIPEEMNELLAKENMHVKNISGMQYSFLSREWKLSQDTDINYILSVAMQYS